MQSGGKIIFVSDFLQRLLYVNSKKSYVLHNYRKTSFLIPGTKSRTKKKVLIKFGVEVGFIRVLGRHKTRKIVCFEFLNRNLVLNQNIF